LNSALNYKDEDSKDYQREEYYSPGEDQDDVGQRPARLSPVAEFDVSAVRGGQSNEVDIGDLIETLIGEGVFLALLTGLL
jgi:hypothetical protein